MKATEEELKAFKENMHRLHDLHTRTGIPYSVLLGGDEEYKAMIRAAYLIVHPERKPGIQEMEF